MIQPTHDQSVTADCRILLTFITQVLDYGLQTERQRSHKKEDKFEQNKNKKKIKN